MAPLVLGSRTGIFSRCPRGSRPITVFITSLQTQPTPTCLLCPPDLPLAWRWMAAVRRRSTQGHGNLAHRPEPRRCLMTDQTVFRGLLWVAVVMGSRVAESYLGPRSPGHICAHDKTKQGMMSMTLRSLQDAAASLLLWSPNNPMILAEEAHLFTDRETGSGRYWPKLITAWTWSFNFQAVLSLKIRCETEGWKKWGWGPSMSMFVHYLGSGTHLLYGLGHIS